MSIISKVCLTCFEIVNEIYLAAGAGLVGAAVVITHGLKNSNLLRNLAVASISIASFVYVLQSDDKIYPTKWKVVFISGCDSGLGFSLAQHVAQLGFTVVGGFLSLQSDGAKEISKINNIEQIELDITRKESIANAVKVVEDLLNENIKYELFAVVNNAAVMVFGEFEWLTDHLVEQQVEVNLLGTLRLTKRFCPLLRKYKGRIINITSHCADACLPGLSVYGATKAALKGFCDSLRVEMGKYGVKVINFIPGSFVNRSGIMLRHDEHVKEMRATLTLEQWEFYEDYFERYHNFLLMLKPPPRPEKLEGEELYSKFEQALMSRSPKSSYKTEPPRYAFYHLLFKISPVVFRDYFVRKFMMMPEYSPDVYQENEI